MTETRTSPSPRTFHRRRHARRGAVMAAVAAMMVATLSMGALPDASASVQAGVTHPCDVLSTSEIEEALSVQVDDDAESVGETCYWTIPVTGGVPAREVSLRVSSLGVTSEVQIALSKGFHPVDDEANAFVGLDTQKGTSTPNIVEFVGVTENLGGFVTLSVHYDFSTVDHPAALPADENAVVTLGLEARDRYKAESPFAKVPKGSEVLLEELLAQPTDAIQPFADEAGTAAFEKGGLTVTVADPNAGGVAVVPQFLANGPKLAPNVRVEVDTKAIYNASVILVCRYGDVQYYGFGVVTSFGPTGISSRGTEFITAKYTDRDGFELLTKGSVPDDLYGHYDPTHERNHLVVDCRGPEKPSDGDRVTASFTINGKVHKVVDKKSLLGNGAAGVIIEKVDPEKPSPGYVTLTNLRVTQLPG